MSSSARLASRWNTLLTVGVEQPDVVADHQQPAGVRRPGSCAASRSSRRRGGWSARPAAWSAHRRTGSGPARPGAADRPTGSAIGWCSTRSGRPEVAGDPGRLRLGRVPAGRGQLGLGPRVRGHRLVPHLDGVVGHRQLGSAQPLHDRVQPAGRQDAVLGQHVEVTGPRILRQVADLAGPGDRCRPPAAPRPARILVSVVLPAPLRPTSPILSPAATWNEACSSSRRAPARTSRSFATSIGIGVSVSRLSQPAFRVT